MINNILLIVDDKIDNFIIPLVLLKSTITESLTTIIYGRLVIDFLKDVQAKAKKC